jgi:hypothetical protein
MRESKPHGFVAWLFDVYIISFALGAVVAVALAVAGQTGTMAIALVFLGFTLALSLVYHLGFARRVLARSPGELIAGRFIRQNAKVWLNPYSRTRLPLFATMLVVTVLAGNTWDGIGRGSELSLGKVVLELVALVVLVVGLTQVGQGRAWWMLAPAGYATLLVVTALSSGAEVAVPSGVLSGVAVFFAFIALLSVVMGLIYARLREEATAPAV